MQISTSLAAGNAYPVGGAYYQDLSPYIPTFDKTKPIIYKWRANIAGNRTQENNDRQRAPAGGRGRHGRQRGITAPACRARYSKTMTDLTDGYVYTTPFYKVLGSGIINPFSVDGKPDPGRASTATEATKFRGHFQHGRTTLTQVDAHRFPASCSQLPAGPLAGAVGIDLRREGYGFAQDVDATTDPALAGQCGLRTPRSATSRRSMPN